MSYQTTVYSKGEHRSPLAFLLENPARDLLTSCNIVLGIVGVFTNVLVIAVFSNIFTYWRYTTRMWVNLCVCLLASSLTSILRAVGDLVEDMSNSSTACNLRILLPIAMDIACLAGLPIMFIDRITVLQFPNLHIYNQRNNNCKLMYSWFLGSSFFAFKMFLVKKRTMPSRCLGPFTKAFPIEVVTQFVFVGVLILFLTLMVAHIFTPYPNNALQKSWIKIETRETASILWTGTFTILLWAPKFSVQLEFVAHGFSNLEFQILVAIMDVAARGAPLIPLATLIRRKDFRMALRNFFNLQGERSRVKQLIAAEEAKADFLFHTVVLSMYPNHPELVSPADNRNRTLPKPPSPKVTTHTTTWSEAVVSDHIVGLNYRSDWKGTPV